MPTTLPCTLLVGLVGVARAGRARDAVAALPTLEDLAYYYGTDKSRDDHKYTALYSTLFEPIRHTALNVTEVGIATGQSLQMWHDYFDQAHIWGIDSRIQRVAGAVLTLPEWADRVHILKGDSRTATGIALRLANESMDVIIDDGDHAGRSNELTMLALWRTLRPGGFYCIEDIATGANGMGSYNGVKHHGSNPERRHTPTPTAMPQAASAEVGVHKRETDGPSPAVEGADVGEASEGRTPLVHFPETWSPEMREILTQHETFFVDTAAGHRDFERFVREGNRVNSGIWSLDRLNHNSHVLVIRKRAEPLSMPFRMNTHTTAMMSGGAVRPRLNLSEWRRLGMSGLLRAAG